MTRNACGFTVIEVVTVILIGGILTVLALPAFQGAQSALTARNGKTVYATLQQRARAQAIEMGTTVVFQVDASGDSAWLVTDGTVSDVMRFRSEMDVDLRATPTAFLLCMTPRGYADPGCPGLGLGTALSAPLNLEFWAGADSSTLTVLPMGQLVGM